MTGYYTFKILYNQIKEGIVCTTTLSISFKGLTRSLEQLPNNKEELIILNDKDISIAMAVGHEEFAVLSVFR